MTEVREDPRLDRLVDLVVRLASGDLAARLEPSSARDAVDAVITGINLLADELEEMYQDLEQRVAERTAALDQAHLDLERMALSDSLTGLANRTLLNDRIQQAVARAERGAQPPAVPVSYTHLRAHETPEHLVCRLLLEKKKKQIQQQ